jgi:hypothetical protein
MTVRRSVIRSWRRLRRPTLGRLLWASVALHAVVALGILAWLERDSSQPPPPTLAPLIVELPPAEPGPPLVRPETPPARSATRPAPPAARPAPAPRPPAPPPAVAKLPEPPPPAPAPAAPAPPPPAVARAPEPTPVPPSVVPDAAPATPAAPVPGPSVPPGTQPESPPAAVAARAPEPAPGARPAPPGAPAEPAESIFSGRQFSLLSPKMDLPPLPAPSGRGGARPDGVGAGESGRATEGQIAIPLNTPDPRYAEYFSEIKRRNPARPRSASSCTRTARYGQWRSSSRRA